MNLTILTGRLGADPSPTKSNSGGAEIRVATSDPHKDKETGEWGEKTTWHNCVVWGGAAEKYVLPYLKKGDLVIVQGRYENNNYEGKDGVMRYQMQLAVHSITNPLTKAENEARHGASPAPNNSDASDEVPF